MSLGGEWVSTQCGHNLSRGTCPPSILDACVAYGWGRVRVYLCSHQDGRQLSEVCCGAMVERCLNLEEKLGAKGRRTCGIKVVTLCRVEQPERLAPAMALRQR